MRKLAVLIALVSSTTALADGAATYNAKCKMCHGPNGEGSAMVKRSIAGTPAETVKHAITEGTGKMKPVKVDNADEVAAYVAGLKK